MRPGLLVNPDGTRTRARVARDSWSTPWPLGSGNEPSGTAGRRHGHSHQIASRPGELVDTAGPRIHADVLLECWSSPRDLGHVPELPRTSVDAAALGPRCELSWTAGQPQGSSDPCLSRPGQLVYPAGPRTRVRVSRDSWSSPHALGPGLEPPGTAGRHRGPSHAIASRLGEVADPTNPWTLAHVSQDSWSSLRAFGTWPESPWTAGQHRGPTGTGPSRLGELV